ncbi:MAG: hypothetical protein VKI82_10740 [Leptolyngbya sp.]|nr:hypothetical protein [Leptolyngbya sp.]
MLSTRPSMPAPATLKPILVAGMFLGTIFWLGQGQGMPLGQTASAPSTADTCEAIISRDARLSRDQLAKLLAIPERDSKENVRQVVAEPYCRLPQMQVRAGVNAEREVYPLAFDPNTHLILLYEGEEYAGYRFRVNE